MPDDKVPETSEDILNQIKDAEVADTEESAEESLDLDGEEEAEETEESEGEEEEAKETSEEETETAEEKEEGAKPRLFKIIVDGKEEFVTEEQIIQYAQKGRFLERERAKDKEEPPTIDYEKAEQEVMESIKRDGFFKTMAGLGAQLIKQDRNQMREIKKQGRVMAENAEWGKDPGLREEFFDLVEEGRDPDEAANNVAVKFWENQAKKGQAKGAEKEKKKQAVKIEKGKETVLDEREAEGEAPTMENFEKLASNKKTSSGDLLKFMKKAGVPIGRDTV